MKTKTFLLLFLFFVIGLTQLTAQNGKNGNGTIIYYCNVENLPPLPVICDGATIDWLSSKYFILKVVEHYVDGQYAWNHNQVIRAEFFSTITGEVFNFKGDEKSYGGTTGMDYLFFNAIGNQGNHYIVHITWDWSANGNGKIVETHASCH